MKSPSVIKELKGNLSKYNFDILLIQEPYKIGSEVIFDMRSRILQASCNTPNTACIVLNPNLSTRLIDEFTNSFVTTIRVHAANQPIILANFYIHPNKMSQVHLTLLQSLVDTYSSSPLILCGDFNARSPVWFNEVYNSNGFKLEKFVVENELTIHNNQNNTCRDSSIVDLTITNAQAHHLISHWSTSSVTSLADHSSICFSVVDHFQSYRATSTWKFREDNVEWENFVSAISLDQVEQLKALTSNIASARNVDFVVKRLTELITHAANNSLKAKGSGRRPYSSVWWSQELDDLKRHFKYVRNQYYRGKKQGIILVSKPHYQQVRQNYQNALNKANRESFRAFASEFENKSPFGNTFKMIKTKMSKQSFDLPILDVPRQQIPTKMDYLLDSLFPNDSTSSDTAISRSLRTSPLALDNTSSVVFGVNEVENIIAKLNNKKAPGLDAISNRMIKAACQLLAPILTDLFNKCVELSYYPAAWKVSAVKVLKKFGKTDWDNPKSYRPICLTSNISKIFEKLLNKRMVDHLAANQCLHPNQHGFTSGKSTVTALKDIVDTALLHKPSQKVALVAVDISGAFDNAFHPAIIKQLDRMGTPASLTKIVNAFLVNRRVKFSFANHSTTKQINLGCPQGGVFSPVLWNVLVDDFLRRFQSQSSKAVAFADDVTFVVWGDTVAQLHTNMGNCLTQIETWCNDVKLKIGHNKTCVLNLHSGERRPIRLPNCVITPSEKIKILGIHFSNHPHTHKISVAPHVTHIVEKVSKFKNIIFAFCARTWGIDSRKRAILYKAVVRPSAAYAAEIWFPFTSQTQRRKLNSFQHQIVVRCAQAYRTASAVTTQLLTRTLAFTDHLQLTTIKHCITNTGADRDIAKIFAADAATRFQDAKFATYLSAANAAFQEFFPRGVPKFIQPNQSSSLFFTGKGPFLSYQKQIGAVESDQCPCGGGQQSPSHLLTSCSLTETIIGRHFPVRPNLSEYTRNVANYSKFTAICTSIVQLLYINGN